MNILLLLTVLLYTADFRPTAALLAVHTALSAIFFSLADMIYKRYKTRALKNIKALLVASPVLYTLMLISLIIFKGIPFSSKFAIEFSLYAAAYNLSVYTFTLLLIILVFIGNTIISIQHFKIAFGSSPQTVSDLQAKEILTLLIPICTLTLVVV
jgi:formate hydrogenlyase subunit 3/multisubunit Na+/H+ antiporter MnhD subunit